MPYGFVLRLPSRLAVRCCRSREGSCCASDWRRRRGGGGLSGQRQTLHSWPHTLRLGSALFPFGPGPSCGGCTRVCNRSEGSAAPSSHRGIARKCNPVLLSPILSAADLEELEAREVEEEGQSPQDSLMMPARCGQASRRREGAAHAATPDRVRLVLWRRLQVRLCLCRTRGSCAKQRERRDYGMHCVSLAAFEPPKACKDREGAGH